MKLLQKTLIISREHFISWQAKLFQRNALEDEAIAEEKIKVEGMSCGYCIMRVKKTIEGIQGVKKVDISLEKKQAVVEFDEG